MLEKPEYHLPQTHPHKRNKKRTPHTIHAVIFGKLSNMVSKSTE